MVAFQQSARDEQRHRLAGRLREAGVPGAEEDHDWIARKLTRCRERLDPEESLPWLEELLVCGLVRSLGLEPLEGYTLDTSAFPEAWLRAVPALLRSGCEPQTWNLVRNGILSCDGPAPGAGTRWTIDADCLRPVLSQWHELGETLVFRNLARGLAPLMEGARRDVQVALVGVDRRDGRRWLRELRTALEAMAPGAPVHFVMG